MRGHSLWDSRWYEDVVATVCSASTPKPCVGWLQCKQKPSQPSTLSVCSTCSTARPSFSSSSGFESTCWGQKSDVVSLLISVLQSRSRWLKAPELRSAPSWTNQISFLRLKTSRALILVVEPAGGSDDQAHFWCSSWCARKGNTAQFAVLSWNYDPFYSVVQSGSRGRAQTSWHRARTSRSKLYF